MPPRLAVLAIVVFWMSTTTWLFFRVILPHWRAGWGEPPPFAVELTSDVGTEFTSWDILSGGRQIGTAFSRVHHKRDRTYEFRSEMTFQNRHKGRDDPNEPKLSLTEALLVKTFSKIGACYHVDDQGKLLSLEMGANLVMFEDQMHDPAMDMDVVMRARVEDGWLKTVFHHNFGGPGKIEKDIPMPPNGSIFNPMQVGTKLAGLSAGQSWRVPLLNPLALASIKEIEAPANFFPDELLANVDEEVITWAKRDVPCFRVDYRRPGENPIASTWARKSDGLVLQQQVKYMVVFDIMLIRTETR